MKSSGLTLVGPLISAWLMTKEYETFAPDFARSPGVRAAIWVSLVITACSVVVGAYARLRLRHERFLHEVTIRLIPCLIFFTVSFAYLNRSWRVHATYS